MCTGCVAAARQAGCRAYLPIHARRDAAQQGFIFLNQSSLGNSNRA